MSNPFSIHSNLNLYISDNAYTLLPINHFNQQQVQNQQSLIINRSNSEISLGSSNPPKNFNQTVFGVVGILGIISLYKSDYLILIQSAKKATNLFKTQVYTPTKFTIYPISLQPNINLLNHSDERYLLSLLKSQLDHSIQKIFFTFHTSNSFNQSSSSWDLTNSLQRQSNSNQIPIWKSADDRFFWNKYLQTPLINLANSTDPIVSSNVSKFILPVISGFLKFNSTIINAKKFTFGLISRRSRYRTGTRYFSRGIDLNGHVSNFNETEMIMTTQPDINNPHQIIIASYVQTRGSVPIFWTEINNLRYRPDLKIMDIPSSQDALKAHFNQQLDVYGDQYLVNLVNSSGYEKPVKEAYEKAVQKLANPRIHYIYFDFHHECKGLRFDRVQGLIDRLKDDLIKQGYYFFQGSTTPIKYQTSVVRSNCMDCLDRTNVVQSALAKWVLTNQLRQAGILGEKEVLDSYPQVMFLFRNLWADNADGVSKAYSGTGALKTDFTRFGKRSKQGAFNDGVNSAIRYFKNNFLDGPRQDSYDLVTGAWRASLSKGKLSEGSYDNPIHQLIFLILIIFIMIFISSTFTKNRSIKASIFSLIVISLILSYILINGIQFVNQPKLISRNEILNYEGPGFQSSKRGRGWSNTINGKSIGFINRMGDDDEKKKRLD
ncbi:hypothetical protein O181_044247 [Austropuccinia psidii MF-1]|uniref:SAC domain-containing protein n=1 Tax=Austropuccinia psidii MF-1 TaxID=1389203 RepID=A0A9Q3DM36_9BASI|nr:hypothetical protein [Austropuccinia psidii MF-1]